ncbi:hypothetical protein [Synechococcus sp. WH 8016]|uniref:hypothetical protein n=1 Tax=Synechococcus sp. WH 8016 TaxID=166318 RepID=UPI00022D9EC6|nr:hypothetical protein [Synechococcus sp. WH 8016]EHA60526.1 hypothetical protein Syn8016DRAFT_2313 [Synechococcus sp. WH 8016]
MGALFFFLVVLAVAYLVAIKLFSSKARTTQPSASAAMPPAAPELSPRLSHQQDSAADKPRQSDESIKQIQEWVSEAVKCKGEKDYEKALKYLDKAYREAAMYEIISNHLSHYTRLPAYLQLAKKNDEGWGQLNLLANGILPHRGPNPTELAIDIDWRIEVSDKTRLFLEREKKFEQALWERCTKNMLSTARAMRKHMEASEAVKNEDWKNYDSNRYFSEELKEGLKKNALWSLEHAEKVMQQHTIEALKEDLWKTAKKAKFEQERVGGLAAEVFATAMSTKSKLHALAEVPDFMVRTRAMIFTEK